MRAGIKRWVWHSASLALAVGILAVLLGRQPWQHLPEKELDLSPFPQGSGLKNG